MRIGIFGGSFNPVHAGHLKLAAEALSELNLDKIYFVPSRQNPLKNKKALLDSSIRVRLLKDAIKHQPRFKLSLCELRRSGPSYTVDTLRYFRKRFGKKTVLYFLSGADTLKSLPRWKLVDQVLKSCRFVVMSRPGHSMQLRMKNEELRMKDCSEKILKIPFDALPLSSTQIRKELSSNRLKK